MLKIVRLVKIVEANEPNLDLGENDDIDFNQVSDNTLAILQEFLSSSNESFDQSSRELAVLPVQAVAPRPIVQVMQSTCSTFEIDELAKLFNSYLHVNVPLPTSSAIAPVGSNSIIQVMQRTCSTFAIDELVKRFNSDWYKNDSSLASTDTVKFSEHDAIEKTVKIEMPHVPGQPKITYIFTEQMWQNLCSALSPLLATTSNDISSASIVEICSDEEEEQGVHDGYIADNDDDDDEGNYFSPNDSSNASDDWELEPISPTVLDAALVDLYHKKRE